ncbi:ABC transporter permease [Paenibacillus sp. FSL R7-269]|nr:ABC transporter permease [Paenibacillus sp. FSL R7-269]
MEGNMDGINIKTIFASFRYWPELGKLLWRAKRSYFSLIIFCYIIKGFLPIINLFSIQFLVMKIEERSFNVMIYPILPLIFVLICSLFVTSILEHFEKLYQLLLINHLQVSIVTKTSDFMLRDYEDPEIHNQLRRVMQDSIDRPIQVYKVLINLISSIITLISSIVIILNFKWWLVIILLVSPLFSFYSLLKFAQIQYISKRKRSPLQRKASYINFLLTNDKAFKEIKLYHLNDYLSIRYKDIFNRFYKEDKDLSKRRTVLYLFFQIISTLFISIVLYIIVYVSFQESLLLGSIYGLVQAVLLTNQNINAISQGLISLCENNLYLDELFSFLNKSKKSYENILLKQSFVKMDKIESIEFINVSFIYPGQTVYALKDLNFKIQTNDSVAFVGRNGSGKSTIIKLMTGLYDDFTGEILINSISIHNYSKDTLYKKIGVIFQDFIQFDFTVRENIGFGDLEKMDNTSKIWNSAQLTGADELIKSFPNQIDQQLGRNFEGGVQISGGQWQKIAISRAFFKDADLYIMDEPSSFLDPESEKQVFLQFQNYIEGKIGVYISHRYTSVLYANRIIVLNEGQVVECGTHQQLIVKRGIYYKLFSDEAEAFQRERAIQGEILT